MITISEPLTPIDLHQIYASGRITEETMEKKFGMPLMRIEWLMANDVIVLRVEDLPESDLFADHEEDAFRIARTKAAKANCQMKRFICTVPGSCFSDAMHYYVEIEKTTSNGDIPWRLIRAPRLLKPQLPSIIS